MSEQMPLLVPPPVIRGPLPPVIPVNGRTLRSRHASATGAAKAVRTWGVRTSEVLQLIDGGPKSRQELDELTQNRWRINGICSAVGYLLKIGRIEENPDDWEVVTWPDGTVTKRVRFRIKR